MAIYYRGRMNLIDRDAEGIMASVMIPILSLRDAEGIVNVMHTAFIARRNIKIFREKACRGTAVFADSRVSALISPDMKMEDGALMASSQAISVYGK